MTMKSIFVYFVLLVLSGIGGCAGCSTPIENTPPDLTKPQTQTTPASQASNPNARTRGAVSVEFIPQYGQILADAAGEVNVLLKLDGMEVEEVERQPLDIAIVIDTSGSMSGDKINSVKVAALELLKKLNKNDQVTLITYANNVQVRETRLPMNEEGHHSLRAHILGIRAGGATALGPALITGLGILESDRKNDGRLSHLMLLSDGVANIGENRPAVLGNRVSAAFERGISISTLGVGLDYNEDLMTHLSDQGGGQYHFVKTDKMIAGVLQDEFKGLMATVAREIILEFAPAPGVTVVNVFGYPMTAVDDKAEVRVGTLRAGQNRDLVLRLRVDALPDARRVLGQTTIRFKNVLEDNTMEDVNAKIAVSQSEDPAEVSGSEHTEVTVRVAEVEGAAELAAAARAVNAGDFAQAEIVLVDSITRLKSQASITPSECLDEQIVEMEQARKDIEKAQTSVSEQKYYVKKAKASAYKKGKRTKGRKVKSTYTPSKKKRSRSSSKPGKKAKKAFSSEWK